MGWLRTVTVGRERDKVKPNGKKRSNLPVTPHLCLLARGRPLCALPSRRALLAGRGERRSLAGETASRPSASWPAPPAACLLAPLAERRAGQPDQGQLLAPAN